MPPREAEKRQNISAAGDWDQMLGALCVDQTGLVFEPETHRCADCGADVDPRDPRTRRISLESLERDRARRREHQRLLKEHMRTKHGKTWSEAIGLPPTFDGGSGSADALGAIDGPPKVQVLVDKCDAQDDNGSASASGEPEAKRARKAKPEVQPDEGETASASGEPETK